MTEIYFRMKNKLVPIGNGMNNSQPKSQLMSNNLSTKTKNKDKF